VRTSAGLYRTTGLNRAIGPVTALCMVRDARRKKLRGVIAVVHLQALSDPARPAIVDGDVRLSYGELEGRINRLTHGLRGLGIGPGEPIAALLKNGHEYLELNAAVAAVGGTNVQVGYRLKPPEVAYILENSGAKALLFHGEFAPVVEEALALVKGGRLDRAHCIAAGGAPGFRSYEDFLSVGDPAEPAIVRGGGYGGTMIYTSGTTGRAKGAKRDFRRMGVQPILNFVKQFPLRRDERHLVVCPLYHSAGLFFVSTVLMVGGCTVVVDHFEPEEILRLIEREKVTSSMMVPTMYARLMALPKETLRKYDLSSLRWLMSGAAPLPTELARKVEDTVGPILYNFYGATETGLVTIAKPGEHTARPGTIGRLIEGNQVRLVDGDGREVPDGQVGELYVKNSMMMDGYHGNTQATNDATRDGFISVGDLAYRDSDGYYYIADRKTDMVISGGVNIYPWEIEQRMHEHPAVHDVAVLGVPDPEWGESLVAFVVRTAGTSPTAEELIEHVKVGLADFKRPRRIFFVDALPRTPTGKVLKRELKARVGTPQAGK
jgi:fatty-acyl-CoA synthase